MNWEAVMYQVLILLFAASALTSANRYVKEEGEVRWWETRVNALFFGLFVSFAVHGAIKLAEAMQG